VLTAEEALRFLDAASAVLAASLAYEDTLERVARLVVPDLADWCGVDIVEDDGSLRQITSGHPDPEQEALLIELRRRYREANRDDEGVRRVVATGQPELFADVRGLAGARMEIREEERELYERLGPKSYVIVPLEARGRVIGALTLLSTRAGRHYGEGDLGFALHLGRRFAMAIDNARLFDAAERSLGLLDTLFETSPVGLAFYDTDLRCVRINEFLAGMAGRPREELIGRTPMEIAGERPGPAIMEAYRQVLRTGEAVLDHEGSTLRDGVEQHWLASYTPVRASDGEVLGIGTVVIDETQRRRALESEREARRRATFLAEAGAVLDRSLDFAQTVEAVANLAVPEFADWCAIHMLDESGRLQQMAVAHQDPAKVRWSWDLVTRYPPDVDAEDGPAQVLRTGETVVALEIPEAALRAAAVDLEHLTMLQELGLTSVVIAPLQSRGQTIGAVTFVSAETGRLFDDSDVELFVELGRRAGVAVENARLYTERSRIAHTLQARLLPSVLPDPPGMRLAARYRAAGEYNEVGGDFYDAFDRAPDEWVVVIGDVSGKGPEAAAVTALARYTIRSAALNDWTPAQVLERLNETLLHEDAHQQFVTVALAYIASAGEDVHVRLVLAGHPLPFVVRAEGAPEQVGVPGTLLGMRSDIRLREVVTTLKPGDTLLLYTDGVIESGPRDAPLGEDGLGELLAPLAGRSPESLVVAVEQAALAAAPGHRARDDVALLAVHATGLDLPREELAALELRLPALPEHLHALREAAVEYAAAVGGADLEAVRLAVGEACANAVMHAYGEDEEGAIVLRAVATPDGLVFEVVDEGVGTRPRPDSPGIGLGMPLMAKLTRSLDVTRGDEGGTVVRLAF
jgi:PAS domain S-box-containing protein